MREYYEELYANKLDQFLEIYSLPKFSQEETYFEQTVH